MFTSIDLIMFVKLALAAVRNFRRGCTNILIERYWGSTGLEQGLLTDFSV
jgi:hypothetical protein